METTDVTWEGLSPLFSSASDYEATRAVAVEAEDGTALSFSPASQMMVSSALAFTAASLAQGRRPFNQLMCDLELSACAAVEQARCVEGARDGAEAADMASLMLDVLASCDQTSDDPLPPVRLTKVPRKKAEHTEGLDCTLWGHIAPELDALARIDYSFGPYEGSVTHRDLRPFAFCAMVADAVLTGGLPADMGAEELANGIWAAMLSGTDAAYWGDWVTVA